MKTLNLLFELIKETIEDLFWNYSNVIFDFDNVPDTILNKSFYINFPESVNISQSQIYTVNINDMIQIYTAWEYIQAKDLINCREEIEALILSLIQKLNDKSYSRWLLEFSKYNHKIDYKKKYIISEINFVCIRRLE